MEDNIAARPKTGRVGVHRRIRNPQERCRLFSLPPELRNEIYTLVFAVPMNEFGRVSLTVAPSHPSQVAHSWVDIRVKPTVLSILQTCRLIRDEAEGLFYNQHHLQICTSPFYANQVEHFVKRTSATRLAAIRTLTVLVADLEYVTRFFRLTAHNLTRLSSLTILAGGRHDYPQNSYHIKCVKREILLLKKVVKYLPFSLSHFQLRLQGNMRVVGSIGNYDFERDIVTEETQNMELIVMSLIARRKEKISIHAK